MLAAVLIIAACSQSPQSAGQTESSDPIQPAALNPDNLPAPPENLVYPWSVVPGGVHSRQSVQQANRDPIVKEHYRAIDVAKLRTERLAKPKSAYVSYRRGDSIYWTRNPVLLKAGETVLTDGESMIRGRCGNMVSETPRFPVAPAHLEPPPAEMEVPVPASWLVAAIPPAVNGDRIEPSHVVTDSIPHANTSILPSAEPTGSLPGYAPHGSTGGFVPVAGGSGGGALASLGPPPESTAPAAPQPPGEPATRPSTQPPIPIVITPMSPPTAPSGPPSFQPPPEWPTHWYPPPPDSPLPPPPVLYPPPDHPPAPPPPHRPPGNPPPGNPPLGNPPPAGPPPGVPPPSDPPPHFPPPPNDPPFDPPPPEDPPGIPEPTAFVLIGLGMIGLGLHLSRKKQ